MKKYLFLIIAFFSFIPISLAECSYEEQVRLSTEAQNVQIVYEIMENTTDEQIKEASYPYNDYIKITVYNITENITVNFTDDVIGGEDSLFMPIEKEIGYDDTENGTYEFDVEIMNQVRNLKATISSQSANCSLKQERTEEKSLPYFNIYYVLDGCKGRNDYYCQKYTNVNLNMSREEVEQAIANSPENKEEPPQPQPEKLNIWKIVLLTAGILIIISLVVAISISIYRIYKRRSVL